MLPTCYIAYCIFLGNVPHIFCTCKQNSRDFSGDNDRCKKCHYASHKCTCIWTSNAQKWKRLEECMSASFQGNFIAWLHSPNIKCLLIFILKMLCILYIYYRRLHQHGLNYPFFVILLSCSADSVITAIVVCCRFASIHLNGAFVHLLLRKYLEALLFLHQYE